MMIDIEYVKGLQSNIHATFDSPQGKEVIKFLEKTCFWYQTEISENRDSTLVNVGKRQVLATIKTLMELSADQIVALAQKEN
jgi:hypothetical protein